MKQKLITVEDTALISGRGLIVWPGPLMSDFPDAQGTTRVELRKPDGTLGEALLSLGVIFQKPTKERRWFCSFETLSKEDVPIGTEIWGELPSAAPEGR